MSAKLKFSDRVKNGLIMLEETHNANSSQQSFKSQLQIVNEQILNCGKAGKDIGPIEELMIVRCIGDHISQVFDPGKRNFLFMTIFTRDESCLTQDINYKSRILSSVVSLAIATHNVAVLDATAVWMQQERCLSSNCTALGSVLIQDYFSTPQPPYFLETLKSLSSATPLFTSNLMASIAQIYAKLENSDTLEYFSKPPLPVLNMIIEWLEGEPLIILTPLVTEIPGVAIPIIPQLAVAPLAKWCIEAPFMQLNQSDDVVKNKAEESSKKSGVISVEENEKYGQLHFLLLQTLQNVASIKSKMTHSEVLWAEHVKSICDVLIKRLNENSDGSEEAKEIALDRFAQIVLVAVHGNLLSGKTVEMWNSLKKLPQSTRLAKLFLLNTNV